MKKRRSSARVPRKINKIKGRPRVLFYTHDGLGLGHLRITLAVAEGLTRHVPSAARLLVTASPSVTAFDLPESLDFVRIPGLDKRSLFETKRQRPADSLPDVFGLRSAIIAATIERFAPHLVVVDHNPAGLGQELLPILNRYRNADSRPAFVLGLRDITYGPELTRREWTRNGSYDLLEQSYDLILVYGSPSVFDPIREYGLSPAVAAKTVFTGFMRRPEPVRPIEDVRWELGAIGSPLVVVSAGGGEDGAPLIGAFLAAMQRGWLPGVVASVVAGPHMLRLDRDRLANIAEAIPGVTFVRFRNDLESHFAAADVVVTMGGYNSVWESIGVGKRPIVVPRQAGSDEQLLRAERVTALGLATTMLAADLTPVTLAQAVMAELRRGATPTATVAVDFDGYDRAGVELARMLGR